MSKKCGFQECKRKAAKLVGHCSYCNGEYCLNHRLPESHTCTCQSECADVARARLTKELMSAKSTKKLVEQP